MAILLLLLALFGFGSGVLLDAGSEESGPGTPSQQRPPAVELETAAGTQRGVEGSYCVTDSAAGVGTCADAAGPIRPREVSIVRPGERVVLRLAGAESAGGTATVRRLGCEERVAGVELAGRETEWRVELPEGAYELAVFATFAAGSASGDTSGVLGLLVDAEAPLEVRRAPPPGGGCGAG